MRQQPWYEPLTKPAGATAAAGVLIVAALLFLWGGSSETVGDLSMDVVDPSSAGVDVETRAAEDAAAAQPEADVIDDAAAGEVAEDPGAPPADPDGLGGLDDADDSRLVIRNGTITVRFDDTFDEQLDEVETIAARHDGVVTDVRSRTDDDDVTRGSVTIDVPAEQFNDLLGDLPALGDIIHRDIRSTDVTEEFTDLESRLRHLEAQEAFFLDLYDEADDVSELTQINQQLADVQERKEQVEGRLRFLDRRVAMSSLTVELTPDEREPEADPVSGTLTEAWADAVNAFGSQIAWLLVGTAGLLPYLLLAAVTGGVWVVWRRRGMTKGEQATQAATDESDDGDVRDDDA